MYSTFDTYNPTKEDLIANAPEGATHYLPENDDYFFVWLKQEDSIWLYKFIVKGIWNEFQEVGDKREPLPIQKVEDYSLKNQQYIHNTSYNELLSQQENPTTLRERILEIRKEREAGVNEEQDLIDKLSSMGFKLIDEINEKLEEAKEQHDLQDWRNWEEGDVVMCQADGQGFSDGSLYTVDCIHPNGINQVKIASDDNGNFNGWCADFFKFISRPAK